MKTSYGERDYPFGQTILTLRTTMGLTQEELANRLCVRRRSVGEWEAGNSYPKAEHLKELIALAVKQKAFSIEHEAEEIRALWQAAPSGVPLDECWLSTLLDQPSSPHEDTEPPLVEETISCVPVMARPTPGPRVDWGDALAIPTFYGREGEKAQLIQWVVQERCRMVSVLGMGGIGKSALLVSITHQLTVGTGFAPALAFPFKVIIFRSLRDAPLCEALIDEYLHVLSPQPLNATPATLEQRISLLLEHLRKTRVLLVLDNLECLLQEGDVRGCLRSDFEGYGQLLRRVAQTAHQSCLLLTSREKPAELRLLENKHSLVHSLRLTGLDGAACKQLFKEKDLVGTEAEQEHLIEAYSGNPLALKIVTETIMDLFDGEIGQFLIESVTFFGCITDLLDEQFARLSALEQSVLCWLAIMREPVTLDELRALLVSPLPPVRVVEAADSLRRRSLIEHGKRPGYFVLQSVVLEYVTSVLIAEGSHEIQQCQLRRLIEHGLSQAQSKEYVRQTQERLLVSPLLTHLQSVYWRRADLEERLLCLLDQLRQKAMDAQGYGPANLITLLRVHRGHLSGLNFSYLCIRGVYLQGIEMHDAKLSRALIRETVMTEAVNANSAIATSRNGRWWAAGSMQGKVYIWEEARSQTLHHIWQAHNDVVWSLAFSPDGRTLASSGDSTIKLWHLDSRACSAVSLLWTRWQKTARSMAFNSSGCLLASGGADATIRLWYPQSGANLQTLIQPSQVYAVAFSPDDHLLASGCVGGEILLWEQTTSSIWVELLSMQTTSWITSLVFSPNGRALASAHWDGTVTLWEVGSLRLLHTLPYPSTKALLWSPDGGIIAGSHDNRIWLWDVEQSRCSAVLHGHTGEINRLAFTPDGSRLLSGSNDSTLRVWDVQRGQCVRVVAGYGVTLCDLDWSPDGTHLVSGGTDMLITIWDLSRGMPSRILRGHTWLVRGARWSPDGRFVASCGWDTTIRIWDTNSGACVQKFEDPSILLLSMAWNPDGSLLACGTHQRGMQVWDIRAGRLRWVGLPYKLMFIGTAWSPDGTCLASGSDDGSVYLWESTDGTLLQQLRGHSGRVDCVGWSPDGRWLASGSGSGGSGELFVWDVQALRDMGTNPGSPLPCLPVRTFAGHPGVVWSLAWCPRRDGTDSRGDLLVTGGSDGMLRWWDVETAECLTMRAAHDGSVRSLRVSPDGRRLASCGDDGAIMIWDLQSFEYLRTLRCDRPYERLDITGIRGLTEAEIASLRALGATEESAP